MGIWSRPTLYRYDEALHAFFEAFPRKRHIEDFHVTDAEDWRQQRLTTHSADRTFNDLAAIRSFYRWVQSEKNSLIDDPIGPTMREWNCNRWKRQPLAH